MRSMMTLSDSGIETEDGLMFDSTRNFLRTKEARIKKQVDSKASKGRKIKYEVMEQLVGFVAPFDFNELPARDDIIDSLFGGLLGKRIRKSSDLEDNVTKKIKSDDIEHDIELF